MWDNSSSHKPTSTGEFIMIIPPATNQRRVLDTWDGFLKEATHGISVQMVPVRRRTDQVPVMLVKSDSEACRLAELMGEREMGETLDATTEHGWLVVLGHLAQALGLVRGLEGVPIGQRQGVKHTPQSKVIEFLVGILGGIDHLQDLNRGARSMASDATIARAWARRPSLTIRGSAAPWKQRTKRRWQR
jgi:hypothetical protein